MPISGTVELDGDSIRYDGEPGCQSHRWGRRHARSWAWAHCSAWDGGEDAVFEGLGASPLPGLPPLTFLYLRYGGEDLVFRRARGRFEFPSWTFSAANDRWRISGAAGLRPEAAVQVRYADPDGGGRHCVNSEIADVAMELYERSDRTWRHAATLTSAGAAHFELGRPSSWPEVPVAF